MSETVPPRLDLTLALVGKRSIEPRHLDVMKVDLELVFHAVAQALEARTAGVGAGLTLITGLADGADQIAGTLFLAGAGGSVSRVLGAILPCPREVFARNSPVDDLAAFDRAAESCAFISVLAETLPPAPPEGADADGGIRRARGQAFAKQAAALLERADILVAIDDPDDEGDIGDTRHTLARAVTLGLPVILLHLGRPGVSLPGPTWPFGADETLNGRNAHTAIAALVAATAGSRRAAVPA